MQVRVENGGAVDHRQSSHREGGREGCLPLIRRLVACADLGEGHSVDALHGEYPGRGGLGEGPRHTHRFSETRPLQGHRRLQPVSEVLDILALHRKVTFRHHRPLKLLNANGQGSAHHLQHHILPEDEVRQARGQGHRGKVHGKAFTNQGPQDLHHTGLTRVKSCRMHLGDGGCGNRPGLEVVEEVLEAQAEVLQQNALDVIQRCRWCHGLSKTTATGADQRLREERGAVGHHLRHLHEAASQEVEGLVGGAGRGAAGVREHLAGAHMEQRFGEVKASAQKHRRQIR
mmetsp:Transcript_74826/g.178636  ORF Transcript_74826/g.178636 Transcript_74826/m.178636 type:complete len:287 (-) Transcript_74826:204-1064(-)